MNKEISKTYSPSEIEDKWYSYWLTHRFFHSEPDNREPFTMVIPPPNVTGILHMGHMLNNTIQDVLIRRARMQGKNACWVPGTDHASIATEAKVVQMLRERNIKKSDLSRDEFLSYAWEWKEKYGGIILEQLKKLGASCDWDRTRFTMEPKLSEAVIDVFIDLHKQGMIYRGLRMVNWDPQGKTAVSDEEVIHKEVNSKLYYIKYFLVDAGKSMVDGPRSTGGSPDQFVVIATTRPETILADTAICVNPKDERFKHLVGKKALVPFINREIPVIADEYVAMDFGTGCLKVTPAHDTNDYELGKKHNLEVIDILDDSGFLNEKAGDPRYIGKDRFAVRKQIAADLESEGHLVKVEEYKNQVGTSERTGAVIEPKLSLQWWVDMKKFVAKHPEVLDSVMNDEIRFHPAKMKNVYKHWIENIKDWCISRQLWWGQQIPAWYDPKGNYVVAKTKDEALAQFNAESAVDRGPWTLDEIKQDEDVVDTWFSSWLWPISVFDGFEDKNNKDIGYYYPTNDLVTAPEIMFFWVARMIIAGYEWREEKPFSNVYYTGIVRDKLRRKMSKSLGNSPDPLELIANYGADGVRMGMLLCSPAGNDILFDESLVEQGRNFSNKMWNAFRLVKGWEVKPASDFTTDNLESNKLSAEWFESRFNLTVKEVEEKFTDYKLSEALMTLYKLVWDDFCSWYLEMIKPAYQQPIDETTYQTTLSFFDKLMKLLHPFMPFITEEIWQQLENRNEGASVCIAPYPGLILPATEVNLDHVFQVVSEVRNLRNQKGISPKEKIKGIEIETRDAGKYDDARYLIEKLSNIEFVCSGAADSKDNMPLESGAQDGTVVSALALSIGVDKMIVPVSADKSELTLKYQKEIEYLQGFLRSVNAKLENTKFVANAKPQQVENERKKKADAETKIEVLKGSLAGLRGS